MTEHWTCHHENLGSNPGHDSCEYELLTPTLAQNKNKPRYDMEHRYWAACGAPC